MVNVIHGTPNPPGHQNKMKPNLRQTSPVLSSFKPTNQVLWTNQIKEGSLEKSTKRSKRIMRIKKKYESGAATNYITRGRALKKLQLSLKDFRRLCILKGIYPHEPLHKKKIFLRKLNTAKAKRDEERVKKLYERRPEYQLDHIVKERYPTFELALRDLDDALCLLFAFAVLPHTKIITSSLVASSRRLTAEFNHYIIESNSLNNDKGLDRFWYHLDVWTPGPGSQGIFIFVFVSIKGIYYEAEIMGERVTWIVGHDRGVGHVNEVDFSVMATFAEFYITMLEFVNFRLYQSIGLFYPPKLFFKSDKSEDNGEGEEGGIYSMACPLSRFGYCEEQIDVNISDAVSNEFNEKLYDIEKRKQLFTNFRFWLNREVPKDALTIIIRCCGGLVSWENCPTAQYYENDDRITHQIIDRPLLDNHRNLNRCYIQPQWVFDSFNRRSRLPVSMYLPGAILPPHLSPFSSDYNTYEDQLKQMELLNKVSSSATNRMDTERKSRLQEKKILEEKEVSTMNVSKGRMHKENLQKKLNEKGHEIKLREMLIPKKRKRVYSKIKRGIKRRIHEQKKLNEKRLKILEAKN